MPNTNLKPDSEAEALNSQFQSVFTHETSPDLHNPLTQIPLMPDIMITSAGVLKAAEKSQSKQSVRS